MYLLPGGAGCIRLALFGCPFGRGCPRRLAAGGPRWGVWICRYLSGRALRGVGGRLAWASFTLWITSVLPPLAKMRADLVRLAHR